MKIKPIKAWAVVRGGQLDVWDIYKDKDVEIEKGEKLIRVIIKPYEKDISKTKKRN